MSKTKEALERIRDLPDEELVSALDRARDELFRLKLGNYTNQVENAVSIRGKRRELARIKTVIRARELGFESQAAASTKEAKPAKPAKEAKPAKASKAKTPRKKKED
jgi:large subunit ribosomal protein L29